MVNELVRSLRRTPANAAAIVATLALSIAAITTIFSVVDGVLLRPLPFAEQERLLLLWQRAPGVGVEEDWFSPAQYFDIKEQVVAFERVALFGGRSLTLRGSEGVPLRIGAIEVTSSFFEVLSLAPTHGRVFEAQDDLSGADPKVLLGHRFFVERHGADPTVVGETMMVNQESLEIVGVLPPGALDAELFPTLSTLPEFDIALSMPMGDPQQTTRGSENYNLLAKVGEGIGTEQLETELLAVAGELAKDPLALGAGLAAGSEFSIAAVPLLEHVVGSIRTPLTLLLGATFLLLCVACVNVANLLRTRWAGRAHELAVRAALGASRTKLVVQSLREGLLLTMLGGLLGVALTQLALRLVRTLAPPQLPRLDEVGINLGVMLFVAGACLFTLLVAGVGPALKISSQARSAAILRSSAVGVRARSAWLGDASGRLVVAQVALSLMLAFGAGLLVEAFRNLRQVDHGFVAEGVLSFRISLVGDHYQQRGERVRFFEELWPRLEALPGIHRAGGTSLLPLTSGLAWTDFVVEGFNATGEERRVVADVMTITPGFFDAMGIQLIAGRQFDSRDWAPRATESPMSSEASERLAAESQSRSEAPPVVIVNRAFAERFWPLQDAVGKWVRTDFAEQSVIAGVVETVKQYGAAADTRLAVFFPHSTLGSRSLFGVARSSQPAMALASLVRDAVHELDPSLPVYDVAAMTSRVDDSLAANRAVMLLLVLFAATALILAAVGLYGVLSLVVAKHRREIGVRAALGARKIDLYGLVLRGAGTVVVVGIGLGSLGAVAVSRVMAGMVQGEPATGLLAYCASLAVLVAVAAAASLLPARRAASVDPAQVLVAD